MHPLPPCSREVVRWLAEHLQCAAMVVYEQVGGLFRFSLTHLSSRFGLPMAAADQNRPADPHQAGAAVLNSCAFLPLWLLCVQINPRDAFGQQMLLNLESRGCALLGIEGGLCGCCAALGVVDSCSMAALGSMHCLLSICLEPGHHCSRPPTVPHNGCRRRPPTPCPAATPCLDSQRQRFLDCGWHRADARSMDHVYRCVACKQP